MKKQELLLSVDGGGTKTDMVLFTRDGTVLKRVTGGPTNSTEIGFERSAQTLKGLFESLLSEYGGMDIPLYSVYAGLAGGGTGANKERYRQLLRSIFPNAKNMSNGSDAINALNSGVGTGDGMTLVVGTGSVVFSRSRGNIHQVGGWGHLFGDEGSGFDIGSKGLRQAFKTIDGRASYTELCELFTEFLGQPLTNAIPKIYEGGKRYIASFAPIVLEAADNGDEAAISIIKECAAELRSMVLAGSRFLEEVPYKIVLSGGIWKAGSELLRKLVIEGLDEQFEYIHPKLPPVYGSAIEAMSVAGLKLDDKFEENFASTYFQAY
jgi:N-acetylglucosamine kinase-like BadF-type ATPase